MDLEKSEISTCQSQISGTSLQDLSGQFSPIFGIAVCGGYEFNKNYPRYS